MPLARLYEICRMARRHCDDWRISRVIARPFPGETAFGRQPQAGMTSPIVPPRTVLNAISERGLPVEAVGKVGEIFAGSGITRSHPTGSNAESFEAIEEICIPAERHDFRQSCRLRYAHRHGAIPVGYAAPWNRSTNGLTISSRRSKATTS